jgi:hypothetical protein
VTRKPRLLWVGTLFGGLCGLWVTSLMVLLASNAGATHSSLEHVSIGSSGGNASLDASFSGSSADGRHVVFTTAESLVPADTDASADVYDRSNGVTTLVSTGSTGGNGAFNARFAGATPDGSHIFFETNEKLVAPDTDGSQDVYDRFGGGTTLVSTGPSGGNGGFGAYFDGASSDAGHVFFETTEKLATGDTDGSTDIYDRSGGTAVLVSAGPNGGNGSANAVYDASSTDGSHVFFETNESLVTGDTDAANDVYDRSGATTTLVSIGSTGGNGASDAFFDGASVNGARVFFETGESLVSGDSDGRQDVYERSGGNTALVSTGPSGVNGPFDAFFDGNSADGTHVFFDTDGSLVSADTDGQFDIYERSGGTTTTLISIGSAGGNGSVDAFFDDNSADGAHAFFDTDESLVSADTDPTLDVYDHSAGTTSLVSTGPAGGSDGFLAFYDGASANGTHVFFDTDEPLVSDDTDTSVDIYERSSGITRLVSTGPAGGNGASDVFFKGTSADGTRSFFETDESLLSSDTDGAKDVYAASATFNHPQAAPSIAAALVPVFRQCVAGVNPPTGSHASPLAVGSCPPAPTAGVIAYFGAQSSASTQLTVVPGNPATPADEANVTLQLNAGDIRAGSPTGGDYDPSPTGPDLSALARFRITDTSNGAAAVDPATAIDFDFAFPVTCAATPAPAGSNCSANTSVDALQPGAIDEAKESVIQVFRLRLNDAGPDGIVATSDDKLFAQQGILIP